MEDNGILGSLIQYIPRNGRRSLLTGLQRGMDEGHCRQACRWDWMKVTADRPSAGTESRSLLTGLPRGMDEGHC